MHRPIIDVLVSGETERRQRLLQAVHKDVNHPEGLVYRGMAKLALEEIERAFCDFDSAARIAPHDLRPIAGTAIVYALRRDPVAAVQVITTAREHSEEFADAYAEVSAAVLLAPEADLIYDKTLRLLDAPNNSQTLADRATDLGNWKDEWSMLAITDLSVAILLVPEDMMLLEQRANEWMVHFRKDCQRQAASDWSRIIEKAGDEGVESLEARADCLLEAGEFESAIEDYSRLIEINPDEPRYYDSRCSGYLGTEQWHNALADANRFIEAKQGSCFTAILDRARAKRGLRDIDGAIADAINCLKSRDQVLRLEAISFLAVCYVDAHKPNEATAVFEPYIQDKSTTFHALLARADHYTRIQKIEAAISDLTSAIALRPTAGVPYLQRGILFRSLGKHEQAMSDTEQAIKLAPDLWYEPEDGGNGRV